MAHTMANNSNSFIEFLASKSVKNLDAKQIGRHSPFSWICCKTAPRPCLLASQIIMISLSRLKCDSSAVLLISWLIFKNASSCSFCQFHFESLFSIDLNG